MKSIAIIALVIVAVSCQMKHTAIRQTNVLRSKISETPINQRSTDHCEPLNFKYVVVDNNEGYEGFRHISVFTQSSNATESKLRRLFRQLSKEHSEPNLTIQVFTKWDQVPFRLPSNCEGTGMSGTGDNRPASDYYTAIYFQRPRGKYFKYLDSASGETYKKVAME